VTTALAYITGIALIAAPIPLCMFVAKRQAEHVEAKKALVMADEVMRRTEETSRQGLDALRQLAAQHDTAPCSAAELNLMRSLAISASYLQGVGRVRGDRLVCSSMGDHGAGFPLGPPDFISARGVKIRVAVTLPMVPQRRFIVSEAGDFATIVHRDLVLDVNAYGSDISLAIVSASTSRVLTGHGAYDASWLKPLAPGASTIVEDGRFIVALRRAAVLDLVAVTAIPTVAVRQMAHELMAYLAPFGLLVGLALGGACYLLVRRQVSMPSLLRSALRRDEFFLVYQPIIRLETRQCVGAEALLRWRRGDGSLIGPDLFIPIAEATGIITSITQRILTIVERDVPALMKALPELHVSINFSARDLESPELAPQLREMIQRSGMVASNLMVEATERSLIDVARSGSVLEQIRAIGIGVAIDDFGTGYSSLSYLTQLPVDFLKIDKSFVDTIGTNAPTSSVVLHIIEMAKSLKLAMIAEGVETQAQADFLETRGVHFAQGYLYAQPMQADDFMRYMQAETAER
jgi:sensor c-di-GMP phosphodiesterase-like protein